MAAAWEIVFFQRHQDDDAATAVPGTTFLDQCPPGVVNQFQAILAAVVVEPPPRFAGSGQWEAMHGTMKGFYEARAKGPDARFYRLFCLLERDVPGRPVPALVVIDGRSKPRGTAISEGEYRKIARLRAEYRSRSPRSVTLG